jgi:glycolate oxidase FAD binding subunit
VDLAPSSRDELAASLARASAEGHVVEVRGGGLHSRRGRPFDADITIHTGGLDRVVDHVPADMTMTVEGGVAATEVLRRAGEHGQGWPQAQVRPGATVGGIVAAAVSGRGRLRWGPVRDSLLEVVVATGDGRIVKGGGRTVKTVTGYDMPRLLTGSLGTLGVVVQATIKLWPLPMAEQWFHATGGTGDILAMARGVLATRHRPTAVIVSPGALHVCLSGVPDDVVAPASMAPGHEPDGPAAPGTDGAGIMEVGVPPAHLPALVHRLADDARGFEAWMGTGICRVAVSEAADVAAVRALARAAGGHAQVLDGDDALRADPFGGAPAGAAIMRRIRDAFDPAGVMCPGRFAALEEVPA